jgi:citrate synthase
MTTELRITSEIATHDLHHHWVRGHDLTDDVTGHWTFADLVLLMLARFPDDDDERRLVDAVLVSLVEHGLTPSARLPG